MTLEGGQLDSWVDQTLPRSVRKPETLLTNSLAFSDGGAQNIRALHDLLQAIQPLHLELFHGFALPEVGFLGEGASYKVMQCNATASNKIYAVKQVKLPTTTDIEAFQSRVACVLKDIEVMSHPPLANCDHILNLFGYGWRHQQGDIPYLVTEYALYGTLRQFLRHNDQFPGRGRFGLCRHIALGIEYLHASGVCHGDLKPENVLVVECGTSTTGQQNLAAKISDFGHSLLLSPAPGQKQQKYLGTALYQPPEVSRYYKDARSASKGNTMSVDLKKCDLWAFGLLCWETMAGGRHYYECDDIIHLLWKSRYYPKDGSSRDATAKAAMENLEQVQKLIPEAAKHFCNTQLRLIVSAFTQRQIMIILTNTLVLDPQIRTHDVTSLPLRYRAAIEFSAPKERLVDRSEKKSNWGYECFQRGNSSRMLWTVKQQMASDFHRSGSSGGHSSPMARGAFQYALACFYGFGIERDNTAFEVWLQKSQTAGFKVAAAVKNILSRHAQRAASFKPLDTGNSSGSDAPKVINRSLIATIESATSHHIDAEDDYSAYTQLWRDCVLYQTRRKGDRPKSTVLESEKRKSVTLKDLNLSDEGSVEDLITACKQGDLDGVRKSLKAKVDPRMKSSDGTTAAHWLFMFNDQEIPQIGEMLFIHGRMRAKADGESLTDWVNESTDNQTILDPQMPLVLSGTPLAFAVASASLEAVKALLLLGADPLIGLNTYANSEDRPTCPLMLAVYLHLDHILQVFADQMENPREYDDATNTIHGCLLAASCTSSKFERLLIHGSRHQKAKEATIHIIMDDENNEPPSVMTTSLITTHLVHTIQLNEAFECLTRAISYADFELSNRILECFAQAVHLKKSMDDFRRQRMLTAVETACRDFYDRTVAERLMLNTLKDDISLNHGCYISNFVRPIHLVIQNRRQDLFEWLMAKNVELDVEDSSKRTPLHYMADTDESFCGDKRMERILATWPNRNAQDNDGATPLHYAIAKRNVGAVRYLLVRETTIDLSDSFHGPVSVPLEPAIDLELSNTSSNRPLHIAATNGDVVIAKLLVEAGANVDALGKGKKSALAMACLNQYPKLAEYLIQQSSNVFEAAFRTLEEHNIESVRYLIRKTDHAWINSVRDSSESLHGVETVAPGTLLSFAAYHGNIDMVRCLCDHGARATVRDTHSRRPLDYALMGLKYVEDHKSTLENLNYNFDHRATIALLLSILQSDDSFLSTKDMLRRTPLHYASMIPGRFSRRLLTPNQSLSRENDEEPLYMIFLRLGFDAYATDAKNRSFLHYAVEVQALKFKSIVDVENLPYLVNLKDEDGNTPLHIAINEVRRMNSVVATDDQLSSPGIDICFELIDLGADSQIKNNSGRTAYALIDYMKWSYQQEFFKAYIHLSRRKSTLPFIELAQLERILFAGAQLKPGEAWMFSSLQIWALQYELNKTTSWPRTYGEVQVLGELLLRAGSDLFNIEYIDHKATRVTLLQMIFRHRAEFLDTMLATWVYRKHEEFVVSLRDKLNSALKLPGERLRSLINDHIAAITFAKMERPSGISLQGVGKDAVIYNTLNGFTQMKNLNVVVNDEQS